MLARTAFSRTGGAVRALSTSAPRADLARMQLIGRLVADPEVKTTVNGKEYAAYTVATNDLVLSAGGDPQAQTSSYHRIYAFGDRAERVKTLTKGTQVFVEADFRIERQAGEEGQLPRERLLVQHRSLNVLSRPKPAGGEAV